MSAPSSLWLQVQPSGLWNAAYRPFGNGTGRPSTSTRAGSTFCLAADTAVPSSSATRPDFSQAGASLREQ